MIKKLFSRSKPKHRASDIKSYQMDYIDLHALTVIQGLQEAGFEAYIVGGGVRDQMVGLKPKDFDIATNATPEEVKSVFDNCRLIGRRFRLAHVFFRRHIIEVATYRRDHTHAKGEQEAQQHHSGMITRDNVYGTLEEDAVRRDFTINAIYYDPTHQQIVDHCNGFKDIKGHTVRLIGNAVARFQEDPVRILRAIRIANKLGFRLASDLKKAIPQTIQGLYHVPAARLFDEYIKLFLHGKGQLNFDTLQHFSAFEVLFPLTQTYLAQPECKNLISLAITNTDKRYDQNKPINPAFLIAVFLWFPVQARKQALSQADMTYSDAAIKAASEVLSKQLQHTAMPKRFTAVIREIWLLQNRLERRRPRQIIALLEHARFRAAYDFLLLRQATGEVPESLTQWWTKIQEVDWPQRLKLIRDLHATKRNAP